MAMHWPQVFLQKGCSDQYHEMNIIFIFHFIFHIENERAKQHTSLTVSCFNVEAVGAVGA